ncbi:amidohydrolase family protein [candidate division KSB1 bacterium]
MKKLYILLLIACIALWSSTGFAQNFALTNGTIVTVSGGTIERGTLLIEGERISAVGASVRAPSDAEVIDCSGLFLYPGMIDPNTDMGLFEISNVTESQDQTEMGAFNTFIRASQGADPNTRLKGIARWNGITNVITVPKSADRGMFAGQEVLFNLGGWTVAEMSDKDPVAMSMTFPNFASGGGGRGRGGGGAQTGQRGGAAQGGDQRATAQKSIDYCKEMFENTRIYIKAKEDYTAGKRADAPVHDVVLEGLIPVVKKEIPLTISVSGVDNMREAMKFVKDNDIKAVFAGASDAFRIANELAEANIPILYSQLLSTPGQAEPYDLYYAIPSILNKAGVKFAFSISSTSGIQNLPFLAGMASAYGLPKDAALKSVTLFPAEMYGVDDILGSLEVGKLATVVVTDGDMLEPATKVIHEFIRGNKIDLTDNIQYQQYLKYKSRPIKK